MPYVAPWQTVNPKDFVQAASEGGSLGARLGALATDAEMQKERLASQAAIESARLGASQQESGARLAQAAKEEEMNRALREWELKQQLAQKGTALEAQNQRASSALAQRQQHGEGVLAIRQATNDLRSQQLENAKAAAEAKANATRYFKSGNRVLQASPEGVLIDVTPGGTKADELPSVLNDTTQGGPGVFARIKNYLFGSGTTGTNAPNAPTTAAPPITEPTAIQQNVPEVTSKQEFDALPAGTIYIGKDKKRYRKPGPSDLSPPH